MAYNQTRLAAQTAAAQEGTWMASSTVHCPHCKALVTVNVGQVERCPSCGGELRVHEVGKGVEDEALKRLLSSVKIVERVEGSAARGAAMSVDRSTWPVMVRLGLWGISSRGAAWAFFWLSS